MSLINRDTWIGLAMLLVAVVYWLEADKIRISPLDGPVGASGLPKTLAYALAVLAIVLIVRSVAGAALGGSAGPSTEDDAQPLAERMRPHLRAIGMLAIGVGYLLVIDWLGYALAVAGLLLAVSLYIGAALDRRTVLVAVIGGIFFHLLFVEFLGISLPAGELLAPLGIG